MELSALLEELKQANAAYHDIKRAQQLVKSQLIQEEIPLVRQFADQLFSFSDTQVIHGEPAVLFYVFESSGKTLISPEVYLKKNGDIVYEVFDEAGYRRFRADAVIIDHYNVISVEEFLHTCPFHEILSFFQDRIDVLYEKAEELVATNKLRRLCIDAAKPFFS